MSVLTLNVDEVMRTLSAEGKNPFVVHDKEVDIVRFAINSGFADIVLDGQVALRVMYQRPGETEVRAQTLTYYDTDGLHNYYDWQLSQSDLAKNGSLMVALCILDISGGEVSEWHTTPCAVRVLSTIHTDDSDEGDDTITPTVKERVAVLETMIQRVVSGAPIVVANASAMTDTDQIYVLSTDGEWYYHNGSAWVAGGTYGGVVAGSITTDKLADGAVTTAKIADGAVTADKLSDNIKDAVGELTGNDLINGFAKGAYIKTALSVGSTVDFTPITNANYAWVVVTVTPGEVYNISGTGGYNGCLYAFVNSDSKLIGHSALEVTLENHDIYVPASASKMIINVIHANFYCLYKKEIDPIRSKQIPFAVERYGAIITTGTSVWQVNAVGKHFIIAVTPGDIIDVNTEANQTNVALMTLYGEPMSQSKDIAFASGTGVTHVPANNEYHATVPDDAHFLYVQTLTNDNYSRMPSAININGYNILQDFSLNFGEPFEKIDTLDGRFCITKTADLSWEKGTIDGSTGQPSSNNTRCRTINFIDVGSYPTSVVIATNNTRFIVCYYDSTETLISATPWITSNTEITFFGNAKYIKLIGAFSNNATITDSDIPGITDDVIVTQKHIKTMADVYAELDNVVKTPLTIMTFNVQNFTGLNANETMHEVIEEKYNPDIIGMQEFIETINGASIYDEVFKPYQYHFRYSGIPTPNGIISKKRLFDAVGVEFAHQSIDDPDATRTKERRAYSKAYIYHEGKKICWLNTHLDLNTSTSFFQVAEIKSVMDAEDYSILTADTNINITSFDSTNYINVIKPFVDAGYNVSNNSETFGINWTFSNSATGETSRQSIDTIITSGNMDILSFVADKTKLDFLDGTNKVDHIPIIIKVILN